MKKKNFPLDIISFIIVIFNVISVIAFILPPGRAYYMPDFLVEFSMLFTEYSIFGLGFSGVAGIILNVCSIVYKKRKQFSIKNNIIYLILFALTIPFGWLLFNVAMSV